MVKENNKEKKRIQNTKSQIKEDTDWKKRYFGYLCWVCNSIWQNKKIHPISNAI